MIQYCTVYIPYSTEQCTCSPVLGYILLLVSEKSNLHLVLYTSLNINNVLTNLNFLLSHWKKVSPTLYPEIFQYFTMILQCRRIIVREVGFELRNFASEVGSSSNKPPNNLYSLSFLAVFGTKGIVSQDFWLLFRRKSLYHMYVPLSKRLNYFDSQSYSRKRVEHDVRVVFDYADTDGKFWRRLSDFKWTLRRKKVFFYRA